MITNPFDQRIEELEAQLANLNAESDRLGEQISHHDSTDIKELLSVQSKIESDLTTLKPQLSKVKIEVLDNQLELRLISEKIKSANSWNPKNWFNKELRETQNKEDELKYQQWNLKEKEAEKEKAVKELENKTRVVSDKITAYEQFQRDIVEDRLVEIEKEILLISESHESEKATRDLLEEKLSPIRQQLEAVSRAIGVNLKKINTTIRLENALKTASNSYERALIHQDLEQKFNYGDPRRILTITESRNQQLKRTSKKLERRAAEIIKIFLRKIDNLIIDGNNLCYQADNFIGLAALTSTTELLRANYGVTIIFDASIRSIMKCGDAEIRESFSKDIEVHVVATRVKADETILDLAEEAPTTYIISNDRFVEFMDKSAVSDNRLIRHEIVSGKILINDLNIIAEIN